MCYLVGQTKVGFEIKKVTEVLFFLRTLVFFLELKSLYDNGGKGLGFFKPSKFSVGGRVVNMCYLSNA